MYSALVGHDIDSLYLSSSLPSSSQSIFQSLFYSLLFLATSLPTLSFSLSACLALLHTQSGLLSWHQSASLLPTSVCPENQTEERCRLMIWLETAGSMAVFILFLLFSPPCILCVCVSVCLLFRFNSLVTLLSRIS